MILGGHGITAWGDTSEQAEANSLEIIRTAERVPRRARQPPSRSARSSPATSRCREAERRAKAAAIFPADPRHRLGGPPAGRPLHRQRRRAGVPVPGEARPAGRAGHLVPGPLPAHQGQAAGRGPARHGVGGGDPRAPARAARGLPRRLPGLLRPQRHPGLARRCAGRTRRSCWCPGVGMFSFGKDKQTARVAGEFYVNAINVMRGAESVSTYAPISEAEKFRIEYWALEEAKLAADAEAEAAGHPDRVRHRRRVGDRQGHRPPRRRRGRVRGRRRPQPRQRASRSPTELGGPDKAVAVAGRRVRRGRGRRRARRGRAGVRRGRPGGQQRRAVAVQAAAGDDRRRTGTCSTT